MTFSTWVIAIPTDVATDFALSWVVARATVCIDLETRLQP